MWVGLGIPLLNDTAQQKVNQVPFFLLDNVLITFYSLPLTGITDLYNITTEH